MCKKNREERHHQNKAGQAQRTLEFAEHWNAFLKNRGTREPEGGLKKDEIKAERESRKA